MGNKYDIRVLNKENLFDLLEYDLVGEFKLKELINKEVLEELGLEYGIIYNFDSVATDKIEDLKIDIENIMEARFFNEEKEIRVLRSEDEVKGTIFVEKENTEFIEKVVALYKRDRNLKYANQLSLKKYIDYDEDNQAYIRYTKPCRLFFEEGK